MNRSWRWLLACSLLAACSSDPDPRDVAEKKCRDYWDRAQFWRLHTKRWPKSLKEMEAPLGSLKDSLPVIADPWGSEYVIETEGRPCVRSPGPDKALHTSDDIVYPPRG